MFVRSAQKRYPSLCRYVEHAERRKAATAEEIGAISLMTLAGLAVPGAIAVATVAANVLAAGIIAAFGIGAAVKGWLGYKQAKSKVDRLHVEAAEATDILNEAIHRGRLHRVAPEATTTLLEEAARQWCRARQALEAPFWSSVNLPPHYASLRAQSELAADRAMDETVVLLSQELALPQHESLAEKFNVPELIEGVFGVRVATNSPAGPLPLGYEQARQLVLKLRDLADGVESLTLEVAADPNIQAEFRADAAIDMCLSELDSIRKAELELRLAAGQQPAEEESPRHYLGG